MPITASLEKIFKKVSRLPEEQQNALAGIIAEEMADEKAWSEAFKNSKRQLKRLGEKALKEHRAGRTELLNLDDL